MTSKWHKQHCELNMSDRDIICDLLEPFVESDEYISLMYLRVVQFTQYWPGDLTQANIEFIIFGLNRMSRLRVIDRLIEKLWRLHSQS